LLESRTFAFLGVAALLGKVDEPEVPDSEVIDRELLEDDVATHWLVKSSNISLGNSRPSAARWSSTLDLYVSKISSILLRIMSSSCMSMSANVLLLFAPTDVLIMAFSLFEVVKLGFLLGVEWVEDGGGA
jgi:hypothetical protein